LLIKQFSDDEIYFICLVKTGFSLYEIIIMNHNGNFLQKSGMNTQPEKSLTRLLTIIHQLRSPDGCMWDRQQTKEDIAKYLLDEAYEVTDAVESGSAEALKEELGDLLFQILFLARLSEEAGEFSTADVIEDVAEKMIRRHPHVFGDRTVRDVEEIRSNWEDIKVNVENKKKDTGRILSGIRRSMPALRAAQKITANASKFGFDWKKHEDVLVKVDEELDELKTAITSGQSDKVKEEMGDLFFTLVNVCRFVDVNAEDSLHATIKKFAEGFRYIEDGLAMKGRNITEATLEEMDALWNEWKLIRGK
jgi:tetrapyrrole methylase family protein / MazG family protein